ncbi:MAG: MBL fold metallo-hydrolase [Sedimentisphaerales bacterium]|nr:MBL fold metallo-hydrolase [Sedimentisphaerales bacterium]
MKVSRAIIVIALVCSMGRVYAEAPADPNGKEKTMAVTIQWFGHASFKITDAKTVVYIDPWKLKDASHDATIALVSHSHYDHLSAADIEKVSDPNTRLIATGDVVKQLKKGDVLKPGQAIAVGDVNITGVPAYNTAKKFHPKSNDWLGFIIEVGGKRIYYAGDTDVTEEMKALENIDIALLPVGGTYTMDSSEAADAVKFFKPKTAIPYHWGDIVGKQSDAEDFAKKAACTVLVMQPGDAITLN